MALFPAENLMLASEERNQILKCGEITLIHKRKISFTCNFCVREVFSIGSFIKHILRKHLIFSKADIDALLLEAKSKQRKDGKQNTIVESIHSQQINENDVDNFDANVMEENIKSNDELNEQTKVERSGNVDSSATSSNCIVSTLAQVEDPWDINTNIEEDYEEIELLDELFEKVSGTTEEEIQHRPKGTDIEYPQGAASDSEKIVKKHEKGLESYCNEPRVGTKVQNEFKRINTTLNHSYTPLTIETKPILLIYKPVQGVTKPLTTKPAKTPKTISNTSNEICPKIVCKICKKIFSSQELFNMHVQSHENKPKILTCDYCDKKFSNKSNLNVHVKRHLGIKPYSCSHCDKAFTSSTEVKLHMIKHTGSKMFKCVECDKEFTRQFQLKLHSRRHFNERPYACETCGNTFYDSQRLRAHEAIHSKERPFSCEKCDASFKRLKSLREHSKLHLETKSHPCKICGKTFAQYAGMHAHTKTHKTKQKQVQV